MTYAQTIAECDQILSKPDLTTRQRAQAQELKARATFEWNVEKYGYERAALLRRQDEKRAGSQGSRVAKVQGTGLTLTYIDRATAAARAHELARELGGDANAEPDLNRLGDAVGRLRSGGR